MNKKIGFLILNFEGGGGTERVTSVVANELVRRDFEVRIISCQHGNSCRFALDEGVRLHSLEGERCGHPALRKLRVESALIKYVQEEKIDVMIAVDVALYLYLIPLQMKKLCKCVAWEHFNYYITPNAMVKCARRLAAEHADCVVVLGKNDLKSYRTHYRRAKNVTYIYNPIAVDAGESSPLTRKRAIAVGRLNRQKGFDMLVEAWALMEREVPDWSLDIFGQGPMEGELQRRIDELNLQNIRLRGFSEDIHREYMDSSLFFLSSRYEGFVLVLMEAMATGLPAVSFRCKEGPEETIADGVNGFLVEEGDVRQFADRALRLMKDEKLLRRFASETKRDLARFDTDAIMRQWTELLENL